MNPTPAKIEPWMIAAAEDITEIEGICIGACPGDSDLTAKAVQPEQLARIIARHATPLADKAATAGSAEAGELREMEARKDAAYLERNKVVAALAKCFPSGVSKTAIEGWSEDWHGCVYIDLPTGQVSWHFHDSQAHLFAGLPAYSGRWDGHDTEEKYRRLAALPPAAQDKEHGDTARITDNLLAAVDAMRKLEAMTPLQLVAATLNTDHADAQIVVELMNRVLPGWQELPEGMFDAAFPSTKGGERVTIIQSCDLPDGTTVDAKATWQWSPGDGSMDSRGWEPIEFTVPGFPRLSLEEREHIRKQLTPPQ